MFVRTAFELRRDLVPIYTKQSEWNSLSRKPPLPSSCGRDYFLISPPGGLGILHDRPHCDLRPLESSECSVGPAGCPDYSGDRRDAQTLGINKLAGNEYSRLNQRGQ